MEGNNVSSQPDFNIQASLLTILPLIVMGDNKPNVSNTDEVKVIDFLLLRVPWTTKALEFKLNLSFRTF